MNMRKLFLSKEAKIAVDILIFLALIFVFAVTKTHGIANIHWKSAHCILGVLLIFLMLVHIAQNWKFTKSLVKKKVMRKNKTIALAALVFIPVLITVALFAFGEFSMANLKLHHRIGELFTVLILIHAITKAKRFVYLFKKK